MLLSAKMLEDNNYIPGAISSLLGAKCNAVSEKKTLKLFRKPAKKEEAVSGGQKHDPVQREDQTNKQSSCTSQIKGQDECKPAANVNIKRKKAKEKQRLIKEKQNVMKEKNKRSVFVGNLPVTVKKKMLKKMFQKYGGIESLRFRSVAPEDPKLPKKAVVVMEKFHPKIDVLNAYIVFKEQSSAEKAVELNNTEVDGHHIRVEFLGSGTKEHDHKRSIFVGNLPFDVNEEEVREFFSECGQVENVRIIRDKHTRIGKGFGYVLFTNKDAVLLSLKLNGHTFNGRSLRIQRSTVNPQSSNNSEVKPHQKYDRRREKKRKHSDAGEDDVHQKRKQVSIKFDAKTGKLMAKKDKMKKKLKRRIKKKQKEKLAEMLVGFKKQ